MAIKFGNFAKGTSEGSDSFAHGLGVAPKGMIFISAYRAAETFGANVKYTLGMTDGTRSRSFAYASQNGVNPTNSVRRMAKLPFISVGFNGEVNASAKIDSWDATNVNLTWIRNTNVAAKVAFMAFGGDSVSARLHGWQTKVRPRLQEPSDRHQTISGLPFEPTLAFFGFAANVGSPLPATHRDGALGFGCAKDIDNQWSVSAIVQDGVNATADMQGGSFSDFPGADFPGSCLSAKRYSPFTIGSLEENWYFRAIFETFTSDGCRLFYDVMDTEPHEVFGLFLRGISSAVNEISKDTGAAPDAQSISSLGIAPEAYIIASEKTVGGGAWHSIGGSDGTNHFSYHMSEELTVASDCSRIMKTDKILSFDDDFDDVIDAEATHTSLDATGMTFTWDPNTASAYALNYCALQTLQSIDGSTSGRSITVSRGGTGSLTGPNEILAPKGRPITVARGANGTIGDAIQGTTGRSITVQRGGNGKIEQGTWADVGSPSAITWEDT